MIKEARILFMGTPEFAVASLGALIMNGFNIVAVVSSPDKGAGRGRKVKQSAVAQYASDNYLKLLQPNNLKDPGFLKEIEELKPDIAVVVAFRMLPNELWLIPRMGTFNLHASLLPQYRGAAPINHAIINGEISSGITTFLIDHKIDTGNILLQKELKISYTENAGELHDRLMRSGAKLVVRTVKLIYSGKAKALMQDKLITKNLTLHPAPKIFPKDCFIDWSLDTISIYNFIRGLSPYPGARIVLNNGKRNILVKFLESKPVFIKQLSKSGLIITDSPGKLIISTFDGYIEIRKLQPEGKRVMKADEFLRGIDIHSLLLVTNPPV